MNGYDVVVVGGRVAGASSSRTRASGSRWSSGPVRAATRCRPTGLMRAGVLQLSRWGLLDRVVAAGTPAIGSTLFHYADGRNVRLSIRPKAGVEGRRPSG